MMMMMTWAADDWEAVDRVAGDRGAIWQMTGHYMHASRRQDPRPVTCLSINNAQFFRRRLPHIEDKRLSLYHSD